MSFSKQVKEELLSMTGSARHCQLAELAAIFQFCGFIWGTEDCRPVIGISTENKTISIKCRSEEHTSELQSRWIAQ